MRRFILAFFIFFAGCASAPTPSGFLGDYSRLGDGQFFNQEYIAPTTHFGKYSKVRVDYPELRYFDNSLTRYSTAEIQELGLKLKNALEEALGERYQIIHGRADDKTIVIKPALLEVVAPKRLINVVTAFFLHLSFSRGYASFEAKLLDGGNGKELAAVSEKRKAGGGIKDVKSLLVGNYTRFIHAEGAFKRWGQNLLDLMAFRGGKLAR